MTSTLRGIGYLVGAILGLLLIRWWWAPPANSLVVYCAHDAVFAEAILQQFEAETGVRVFARFDAEATKTLGLVNRILAEKNAPQCDVFWNNEPLGTLDLLEEGLCEPYQGAGFRRIPPSFRDPEGHWVGFAARMRVWIVNTNRLQATADAVQAALQNDLTRVAMAKPLYGTTRFHYSVLWELWGPERLKAWHGDQRRRGLREETGNAMVKNVVAAGTCDLGWTDTDDFFVAVDDQQPVGSVPFRLEDGRTLCVPNTVCIIRGTRHPQAARRFVDFLLSEQTELALAKSKSRQIPLGPIPKEALPAEVNAWRQFVLESAPVVISKPSRKGCLQWLKTEYAE